MVVDNGGRLFSKFVKLLNTLQPNPLLVLLAIGGKAGRGNVFRVKIVFKSQ